MNRGSDTLTDGTGCGGRKRSTARIHSCSRRCAIASGRSGSAIGAMPCHTSHGRCVPSGSVVRKMPAASSHRNRTMAWVISRARSRAPGCPSAASPRCPRAQDVLTSGQATLKAPVSRARRNENPRRRASCTSTANPGPPCAFQPSGVSNTGDASQPVSSGRITHASPVWSTRSRSIHSWKWGITRRPSAAKASSCRHSAISAHTQPRKGGWMVDVVRSRRRDTL